MRRVVNAFWSWWRPLASVPTFAVALILLSAAGSIAAERRVALVIGNAHYDEKPLKNPTNDARDISAKLRMLGFEVIEGIDVRKSEMDALAQRFTAALEGASLGLFYFAGHGLQVEGVNYLMPTDAKVKSPAALDFELVRLDLVQRSMEQEARANVIILDACRDNPFERSLKASGKRSLLVGRGLATVEAGKGTLISFSTQPGNTAADGAGRNSPFTEALLRQIGRPGEDISSFLIRVRNDVEKATAGQQVPWDQSALREKIVLMPALPGSSEALQDDVRKLTEEIRRQRLRDEAPIRKPEPEVQAKVPQEKTSEASMSRSAEADLKDAWSSIAGTTSERILEAYIVRAVGTIYADLARARLEELREAKRQPVSPATADAVQKQPAPASGEAQGCDALWRRRNEVFHRFGYCFEQPRGIAEFGNRGCSRTQDQAWRAMGESNRQLVNSVKQMERANGC